MLICSLLQLPHLEYYTWAKDDLFLEYQLLFPTSIFYPMIHDLYRLLIISNFTSRGVIEAIIVSSYDVCILAASLFHM